MVQPKEEHAVERHHIPIPTTCPGALGSATRGWQLRSAREAESGRP